MEGGSQEAEGHKSMGGGITWVWEVGGCDPLSPHPQQ